MQKRKLWLVVVLVLVLIGTACGKQPSEEVVYQVGCEPTFPPFEYKDIETDEITGFDIDLIKAIAEEEGFQVEVLSFGFDALIPALQTGTIDIVASGMTIDEKRSKQVDFTKPYVNSGLALAVAKNNETIKSEADLKGTKVAVQIGTTGAKKANALKDAGIVEQVKTFDTIDVLMAELAKGSVDAVINDLPVTQEFIKKGQQEIKIVGEPLDSEQYGFAVAKGNEELLEKLDAGLDKVMASGKYEELLEKYDLPENAWPE
ncbi:MAG TPA: basic amino acid ABC transporter substrate-binding protein [Clostridia bacterium]|nr:basic amino acid ABC transporter substrate-binding protein [Clostridia bacterium]